MGPFGLQELIIVLVIVLLLFGVGRISRIAKEMGSGIRAFREGLQGEDEQDGEGQEPDSEPAEN